MLVSMTTYKITGNRARSDGKFPCRSCKKRLARENFRPNHSRSTGIASICRPCELKENRERRKLRHPRTTKSWSHIESEEERRRAQHLWKKYRISLEDYERMLRRQKGKCAICGGQPNGTGSPRGYFHVDHDPDTGKVRGLLCGNCNHGIGKLKHDVRILKRAISYLS